MTSPEGLQVDYHLSDDEFVQPERAENFKKLERYANLLLGTTAAEVEISDPEQRIEMIKSWSPEDFLNICSIVNGILQGKERNKWQGEVPRAYIGESSDAKSFENFETADSELSDFFTEMVNNITPDNLDSYAFQLYTAIVNAHIFPDGNGRLARIAYSFLKNGSIGLTQMSEKSSEKAIALCESIYMGSVLEILQQIVPEATYEDLQLRRGGEKNGVGAAFSGKKLDDPSMVNVLQYVAAVRAGLGSINQNEIWGENWSHAEGARFREEFFKLKSECFWKCIERAGKAPEAVIKAVLDGEANNATI